MQNGKRLDRNMDTSQLSTRDDLPFAYNMVSGTIFPSFISQKRVDELQTLQLRPDDVFVVSYPKSGTTWTQHMVNLIRNHGVDDDRGVHRAVPWIESTLRIELSIEDINKMPSPRSFMSHNPYHLMAGGPPHTSPAKYIHISRNPKDIAVSLYHMFRMFVLMKYSGSWDKFYQLYTGGYMTFGSWFDHVLEWWKHRDADNILFLKYEDIKRDHRGAVTKMAEFMGYNLEEEVVDTIVEKSTFQHMKDDPATNPNLVKAPIALYKPGEQPFLRKGIVGDWKNVFTPEQNAKFDALYAKKMKGSGLDFDFN